MSFGQSIPSSRSASLIGAARALMFLGLCALLVPLQLAVNITCSKKPFRVLLIFYRCLLHVLGFRVRAHGAVAGGSPILFVANHTSYLDIIVLGALLPAYFVAKSEVADWWLIGFLAKLQNTAFIERQARHVNQQKNSLSARLTRGESLILFPEGTSTDGMRVLPFKSSLFSLAEQVPSELGLQVQPVSLVCTGLNGLPLTRDLRPLYSWFGDMTLQGHLWNMFKHGRFTIDVIFHPPVSPQAFPDRKALAAYCHEQVARGMERCLTGRPMAAGRDVMKRTATA
ncbi:MAG: lysophospholipid acyltransferase family protein [Alphaproteobacteria bacterium]|nr:lysophospholipid acyltransferase family protein [Alphaproteobacteria bacterium]